MSVKTIWPILGVGSAFAILGLAASRRRSNNAVPAQSGLPRAARVGERRPSSGVHPSVTLDKADGRAPATPLMSDFWDAAPESYSFAEESMRAPGSFEAYDAVDTEDLSAAWLSRATEAPPFEEWNGADADDPAEIPADSLSMISDASRHAAAFAYDDEDESSDDELARR